MLKEKYEIVELFYRQEMSVNKNVGFSPSPGKPKEFVEFLKNNYGLEFEKFFKINSDFKPFCKNEFYKVHDKKYVDDFFEGSNKSNGLNWNKKFAESIRYTNSSLYHSIKNSVLNPNIISHSPTSGFHHATYNRGGGFCTFSGQVLASLKIYEETGMKGCYIDLDGHFGNSIESYREMKQFCRKIEKVIPSQCNVNPTGTGIKYLKDLKCKLDNVYLKYLNDEIDYFVWCHGADSHIDDPLGTQCDTEQWLYCTELFIEMIQSLIKQTQRLVPISMSLFGGYQKDFDKTLELHTRDVDLIIKNLIQ